MPSAPSRSRWAAILCLVVAMSALPGHAMAAATYPGETLDPSGIALVGPVPYQVSPKNEQQAIAFAQAERLAKKNPNDMGYPWLDEATGTLELSAVNDSGKLAAGTADGDAQISGLVHKATTAHASIAQLDRISDAVTRLHAEGVPHSDLIYMTEPDQQHNRIIITVSGLNEELMSSLASRFGTSLIAVRVKGPQPQARTAYDRNNDSPAFWGGAYWQDSAHACTTGFSWKVGSQYAMLTAGHCAPNGASSVSFSSYANAGFINSGTEENWTDGTGTVYFQPNGQSGCCNTNRGDLALVRLYYSSGPVIYRGGATNPWTSAVARMHPTPMAMNDYVCTSGRVTGEWCGNVQVTEANIWYFLNGWGTWARHVVQINALNTTCPMAGDSGGPVFYTRADGRVDAAGIISGSGQPLPLACQVYVTDIWDAWYGLPGGPIYG